jgi:Delta7-sterol 5-desaturase
MNDEFASLLNTIGDHMVMAMTFDLSRYLIAAGALSLILWLARQYTEARRIQERRASFDDYKREVLSSLRTVFIFAITTLSTVLFVEIGWVKIDESNIIWPVFAIQLIAMVMAHDAYFYWMHRALHHRYLFRIAHLHHHKSRTPTPWAAYSFASFEAVSEAAFVPAYLLLVSTLGMPMYDFAIFIFLAHMIIRNVMGHAGVELFPAGWTRGPLGWITTTTHHDLHHKQGNYNFGFYFTWWDRWMGTEHPQYEERFDAVAKPIRISVSAAANMSIAAFAAFAMTTTVNMV